MARSRKETREPMLQALASLNLSRRARILDAGMGAGELGAAIRERFPDVELTGIDCWLRFLVDPGCRDTVGWPKLSLYDSLIGGAEAELTRYMNRCAPGQYDAIILGDVLEHLPQDRSLAVLERARCIAGNGVVVNIPVSDFPQEPTWKNPLNRHLWWRQTEWWKAYGAEHIGGDERSATFLFRSDVPPAPILSIIIPAYNRRAYLDITLRALLRTATPPWRFEIIVVDDGSVDGTANYIRQEFGSRNVRCIRRTKNEGKANNPGHPRNVGLRQARGKIVAFMDSDILHCHDIITATLKQAITPGLWKAHGSWVLERDYKSATEVHITFSRQEEFEMPGQFWWAAERELLIKLGGFDERYTDYGAEDEDFWLRILRCNLEKKFIKGQFAVGLYASRGLAASGGIINRAQNVSQHKLKLADKTVVRNVGIDWGRPV